MSGIPQIIDYEKDQLAYALANAVKERDELAADLAADLAAEKITRNHIIEKGAQMERELAEALSRAKELAELVDGAYILVELHKPEGAYNKKWREAWLEKAKRLIPGVDSLWH